MEIRSVRHKGLRRFLETESGAGLPPGSAGKLAAMISYLQQVRAETDLERIRLWRAHRLTGNRKGIWALHVTANWRLTFGVDAVGPAIIDLDLEDYH